MNARLFPILALAPMTALALACTESVRGGFPGDGLGEDGGAALPPTADAEAGDGASSPIDEAPPDLTTPTIACVAKPCALELVRGDEHFCARLDDGTVRCWGDDTTSGGFPTGTLGSSPPTDPGAEAPPFGSVPIAVPGLSKIVQLSAQRSTTCARDADGKAFCWGENAYGQLGLTADEPTFDQDPHPQPAAPAVNGVVEQIDVGIDAVCARLAGGKSGESGKTWCWGDAEGDKLLRPKPSMGMPLAPGVADMPASIGQDARLDLGVDVGFARTADGKLFSWGRYRGAAGGVLGRISSLPVDPLPIPVSNIADSVFDFTTDGYHACALALPKRTASAAVWCWGGNGAGQLGNGVQDDRETPALVRVLVSGNPTSPQRVFMGDRATCLRMTNGAVYCAGSNASGRLGLPATTPATSTFKPVPGIDNAVTVAVGSSSTCALLVSGEVACWGSNRAGQLGIGTHDELPHPAPSKVAFR